MDAHIYNIRFSIGAADRTMDWLTDRWPRPHHLPPPPPQECVNYVSCWALFRHLMRATSKPWGDDSQRFMAMAAVGIGFWSSGLLVYSRTDLVSFNNAVDNKLGKWHYLSSVLRSSMVICRNWLFPWSLLHQSVFRGLWLKENQGWRNNDGKLNK